jgi:hypothetical protein
VAVSALVGRARPRGVPGHAHGPWAASWGLGSAGAAPAGPASARPLAPPMLMRSSARRARAGLRAGPRGPAGPMQRPRGARGAVWGAYGSAAPGRVGPMSGSGGRVSLPGPARRKIKIIGPELRQAAARRRAAPGGAGQGARGWLGRAGGPAPGGGWGGGEGLRGPRRPLGGGRGGPRCCAPRRAAGTVGSALSVGGHLFCPRGVLPPRRPHKKG